MLRYLLAFRVNIAIVFLGAFSVMALIKLSSYLPAKYYFSFSKLFAGASEPFIVDPPSVTGAKLCALMSKHNLSPGDIGRSIDCSAKLEVQSAVPSGTALFEPAEIDRIYSTALRTDPQLRQALVNTGSGFNPEPLAPEKLDEILSTSGSVNEAYRRIWETYSNALYSRLDDAIGRGVKTVFGDVRVREAPQAAAGQGGTGSGDEVKLKGLSDDETQRIRRAHQAFLADLAASGIGAKASPLTKTKVDEIIKTAYSADSIQYGVTGHYRDTIIGGTEALLRSKFSDAGVTPVAEEQARRILFQELVKDGLNNYIIATLIRLVPVLIIGLVLGFMFGRAELLSSAFAGALAAFLLTWPIMLMWDRMVQSTWHDQKLMFMGFYAVYIISFFLTAKVGALIGIRAREGAPGHITGTIDRETAAISLKGVSWGELATNIVIGLLANGAVAAWNLVIPLSAA